MVLTSYNINNIFKTYSLAWQLVIYFFLFVCFFVFWGGFLGFFCFFWGGGGGGKEGEGLNELQH